MIGKFNSYLFIWSLGCFEESSRSKRGNLLRITNRYFGEKIFSEGGTLNVCRKNNVGNSSDRRFHDVHITILLFPICFYSFRKDHLLRKAIQDQKAGVYDKDSKSLKREEY